MDKKTIKGIFPWNPKEISEKKPAKLSDFVNGKWVGSKDYKEIVDPLTGKLIILMPDTQIDEIGSFLKSLAECPKYGLHNPFLNVERYDLYGKICLKAAEFLRSNEGRDYFAKLIQRVMPKDIGQCYGEVDIVTTFLENFSGDGVRFLARAKTTPGTRLGQQSIDYRWPYGPVAIISVFNFPLEIMALQLMGALFMGNKPILKQSSLTSIVGEAFVRLLLWCGLPKDDLLLIHCKGSVMEYLITEGMPDPIVQLTQFTGSSETAEKLLRITEGRIKKEDSGFDWKLLGPNVIPSKIDLVAETSDKDAYAASGQKCSAQSILFLHKNWQRLGFEKKIRDIAAKRNLKDLTIGPVLTWDNHQFQEHIDKLLQVPGAKLLFGGKPLSDRRSVPKCYGVFEPTAVYVPLNQIMPNIKLVAREVFGPVQIVTVWESKNYLEKILAIIEKFGSHLTAGVADNGQNFLNYVLGRTTNGTTYAGIRARTTGAPQWHFFGPCGHPACAGIGTPEAIINTWSQNRTIIFDVDSGKY